MPPNSLEIIQNVFDFIKRIIITYSFNREKKFSRLDGSMHFEDRQQNIDRFNEVFANVFSLHDRVCMILGESRNRDAKI